MVNNFGSNIVLAFASSNRYFEPDDFNAHEYVSSSSSERITLQYNGLDAIS